MGQAQSDSAAPPATDPVLDEWPYPDQSPLVGLPPATDRPLPEDPLDPTLLSRYKCPIEGCVSSKWCPFGGHPTDPETPNLRILPKCFCVERLLGRCEMVGLERLNPGDLVRCEAGFHPDEQDLLEPGRFVQQVASAILGRSTQAVQVPNCVVCLKPLPTLQSPTSGCYFTGYLENCIHRFCGKCIQHWRDVSRIHPDLLQFRCPMCRALSCRIMLWPEPLISPRTLALRFSLQKAHFGILVGPKTMFSVKEWQYGGAFEFTFMKHTSTHGLIHRGILAPGITDPFEIIFP